MKHAIIVVNPSPKSFIHAMAAAYRESALAHGHTVIFRDLYAMHFDPVLKLSEIPSQPDFAPGKDIIAEREILADVQSFAFFYPIWINLPPAILKGYLERVFSLGFAFSTNGDTYLPLLKERKFLSFTSSGAPTEWLVQTGRSSALRTLFDHHFSAVFGLEIADQIHFGGVAPGIGAERVISNMETVRTTFAKHFAAHA